MQTHMLQQTKGETEHQTHTTTTKDFTVKDSHQTAVLHNNITNNQELSTTKCQ